MKPKLDLQRLPWNSKGFSLIEVMVALGILSIGILAVASMQISATQGNLSARLRTEAITMASERLETLISGTYASISSGTDNTHAVYNLSWTVTDDTPINGTKTIAVTVTWTDRNTAQSATLNYIKANL